jgi:uncharacterized protein YndB with AHSA1/START domain
VSSGSAVVTLPSDTQILIRRGFDAPRHLVFEAYTKPEHIRRWWSGGHGDVTVAEVDLRVGGTWRYAMTVREGGFEIAFHGEFREIVPDERIVNTEVFEGMPDGTGGGEALNIVTFTEADGRTTLEVLVEMPDRESRDALLATGMESGMQASYDLLEQVSVTLPA